MTEQFASLRLIVVRHAATHATGVTLNGCGPGAADPPVRSVDDAVAVGERLRAIGVPRDVHLWCSDTRRARQTADGLGFGTPEVDARLNEVDFGQWEGRTPQEAFTDDAEAYLGLWSDPSTAPPQGESLNSVAARVDQWRAGLTATSDGQSHRGGQRSNPAGVTAIAVAHATTVRVLIAGALAVPLAVTQRIAVPAGTFADLRFYPDGCGGMERLESPVPSGSAG